MRVQRIAGACLVAALCAWGPIAAQAPQAPPPQPQPQPPGQQPQPLEQQPQPPGQEEEFPQTLSASAQRIYNEARAELLQVRTLLKGQDTQASVGSGFLVTDAGHIITNYHVVSQAALQPERYRLVYSTSSRKEGALQILAFDASFGAGISGLRFNTFIGSRVLMGTDPTATTSTPGAPGASPTSPTTRR